MEIKEKPPGSPRAIPPSGRGVTIGDQKGKKGPAVYLRKNRRRYLGSLSGEVLDQVGSNLRFSSREKGERGDLHVLEGREGRELLSE